MMSLVNRASTAWYVIKYHGHSLAFHVLATANLTTTTILTLPSQQLLSDRLTCDHHHNMSDNCVTSPV
jgi:hypothetical protein